MKIMETSFKRICAHKLHSVPLTQQQATADSHLCCRLPDTPNLGEFLRVSNTEATWLGDLAQAPS